MRRRTFSKGDAAWPRALRKYSSPCKSQFAREMRRSQTTSEDILWQRIRRRQCVGLRFRRQAVILGWIVDFWCPALRLVVEVDGPHHAMRQAYDERRDEVMSEAAISVLRIPSDVVMTNIEAAIERIMRMARALDTRNAARQWARVSLGI
jgi:very-short-patch-repair endonuclease